MTDNQPDGALPAVQQALRSVAAREADQTVLDTLAASEVLLPIPAEAETPENAQPGVVSLPVVEQADGGQLVPVFTSQERMEQAFPTIQRSSRVVLGALAQGWPSPELSLIIDAGTPEEVALTAQGVQELLVPGG